MNPMTTIAEQRPHWLERLSDHILRNWTADAWREVFNGDGREQVVFRQQQRTLLCGRHADGWDRGDLAILEGHFGATSECSRDDQLLMAFASSSAALRSAVVLQKLDTRASVRTGVATGRCTVAEFTLHGRKRMVTLGPVREQAEDLAERAATGSIALCPASYELLAGRLARDLREALVVTEMESATVLSASVILPPQRDTGVSTFTGLGLA